ncbi:MAG: thioredoxin family protein [Candidatus Bathyarchaeota archaeon]|nr:thioredoxin family protein [Candidatus Bathyarchaeota archaeon]
MLEIDNKKDLDKELAKNKKTLVLFYASWCGFCMRFVPAFNKMVAGLNAMNVIRVLLDDYENPLWDDYDVAAVPTVIYFEEGKVCKRFDGSLGVGLSEKQFSTWLQRLNAE